MVKKAPESKQKKAAKIMSSSSKEKKKWTQGKSKDVVKRSVTVDAELFFRIEKEVSKMPVVTSSHVAEKFNLNVGVSQRVLEHLCRNGVLNCLRSTSRLKLYGRAIKAAKAEVEDVREDLPVEAE